MTLGITRPMSLAAIIMGSSYLLSRLLGLVREQVLAGTGGTGASVDAYVTAFLIPEFLNHFMASGFLSITFLPIFQRYILKYEHDAAWRVFSNLLTIGTVVFGLLIAVSIFFTDDVLFLFERMKRTFGMAKEASRDPEWVALTVKLTRIVLPAQLFLYWGSFLTAVQFANKRFLLPALQPLCYNLCIIAGGVFLGRMLGMGIEGFAWGVLVGAFAGGVAIQLPGALKVGMRLCPHFNLADPDLRRFVLLSLPFIAGMGMAFANEVFFRVFAQFLPAGALASLNYGLRLTMMLEGVFGQAIAVAAFPYLSQLARENKREQMCRLSGSVIQKICAAVLPLSGIALPLTPQILAVLFQRGAFSAASTSATAPVLAMYLIGAFAFAANAIVLRNFYAVQNTLFPMIVSSIAAALSLPIYWALGHAMGAPGIALATSLSIIAQFLFLYIAWSKRENDLAGFGAVIARIGQMFAITAAGAGVCAAIKWSILAWLPLPAAPLLRNIAVGVGAAAPSLAATLAIFHMTGLANIRDIANAVLRRRTHTPQQA